MSRNRESFSARFRREDMPTTIIFCVLRTPRSLDALRCTSQTLGYSSPGMSLLLVATHRGVAILSMSIDLLSEAATVVVSLRCLLSATESLRPLNIRVNADLSVVIHPVDQYCRTAMLPLDGLTLLRVRMVTLGLRGNHCFLLAKVTPKKRSDVHPTPSGYPSPEAADRYYRLDKGYIVVVVPKEAISLTKQRC